MNTLQKNIQQIISFGVMAPSGENCQPWRFEVRANEVRIYNIPERDQSLYSWGQRSSYFAHGALLENILIAAQAMGFEPNVKLFPDPSNNTFVARVILETGLPRSHSLFSAISERSTNRKVYENALLAPDQRREILEAAKSFRGARLILLENFEKRRGIARAAAVNEELLFGNEHMHRFFFEHINWTKEEDQKKSVGFYIDTLELPPPARFMFRFFRRWSIARLLGKVGFPKKIAEQNTKTYASGAALGAILIPNTAAIDFINAGWLAERIWLKTTHLGLSFQPLAGVTFLMLRVLAGDTSLFSREEVKRISWAYKEFSKIFEITDGFIPMVFRLGHSSSPTAHASRLVPEVRFLP